MKIPPSKYHIGDEVLVLCKEAGCPPTFQATVCTVNYNPKTTEHEYTVDENGQRIDGYTENWLTMRPVIPRALKPPPGK